MSTRAVIARPHPDDPARWTGTYLHGDGYPTGGGKFLFRQVVVEFGGDPEKAAQFFIDQHPAGWSSLGEIADQNECYCHDRGEPDAIAVETETGAGGMDFTYVLRPEGLEVRRWDYGMVALVAWSPDNRVDWGEIEDLAYAMTG
jgi:hypothetical protein